MYSLVDVKNSPFPDNTALILSKNEVKYIFANNQGFCSVTKSIEKVMRYTIDEGGQYAMHILGSNISVFLTEINGQLMILDLKDGNLNVMAVQDYVDCCWEEFFPH